MPRWNSLSLTWQVVLINGTVFVLGTALLAFSPATVSPRPLVSELVVLLVGLGVMLAANAWLVHASLLPVQRIVDHVRRTRSTTPDERLPVPAAGVAHELATSLNDLLDRLESSRRQAGIANLSGQEAERARIAQELHDGVGQSLTALLLELGHLSETGAAAGDPALARAREATRASLEEVRTVSHQLRPHVLEDLGLRSALAALTTDLFAASGTHVRRGVVPGLPRLSPEVELVVFRVAQEALTNVARHARAGSVELTLGPVGGTVELTVADDGRGLPDDADGSGLRGMHDRAGLVGGELSVGRREGGGTRVHLSVPVVQP